MLWPKNYLHFDQYSREWRTSEELTERSRRWHREEQERLRARFASDAKPIRELELLDLPVQ